MMRTFISHFTPSKYFYNFLIILVTHIFQSNKKPGKPLIVRAFPAFPGQSPTVPTISLFLTFILLGYICLGIVLTAHLLHIPILKRRRMIQQKTITGHNPDECQKNPGKCTGKAVKQFFAPRFFYSQTQKSYSCKRCQEQNPQHDHAFSDAEWKDRHHPRGNAAPYRKNRFRIKIAEAAAFPRQHIQRQRCQKQNTPYLFFQLIIP